MAIIKNTIVLDDQATDALKAIQTQIDETAASFSAFETASDSIAESFGQVQQYLENLKDPFADVIAQANDMQESFENISDAALDLRGDIIGIAESVSSATDEAKVFGNAFNDINAHIESVQDAIKDIVPPLEQTKVITENVQEAAKNTGSAFDDWKGGIVVANQALQLTQSILGRIRSLVRTTLGITEAETSIHQRINTLVRNRSASLEDARRNYYGILDTVNRINEATDINTTELSAGAAALGVHVQQTETIEKLLGSVADLAAGYYGTINLSQSQMEGQARRLGLALQGNLRYLERQAGIKFDDAQREIMKVGSEAERAALLVDMIGASFGGAAQNIVNNTPYGAMARMNNALNDIQHTIGEIGTAAKATFASTVTPLIERAGETADRAAQWIRDNVDTVIMTLTVLGTVVGAVAAVWAVKWAIKLWPVTLIIGAIVGLIALLNHLGVSSETVAGVIMGTFSASGEFLKWLVQTVANAFITAFEWIVNAGGNASNAIRNMFWSAIESVISGIDWLIAAINRIPGINIGSLGDRFAPGDRISERENREYGRIEWTSWDNVTDRYNAGFERGQQMAGDLADTLANFLDFNPTAFGGQYGDAFGDFGSVSTGAGKALLVSDPANREIIGEFTRLFADIAGHRYASGVYQQRQPAPITMGEMHIHPQPGMDVKQVAQECAKEMAYQLQQARNKDLRSRGGYGYGGVIKG